MIGGTKLELRNMNSIHKRLSLLFVLLYLHLKSGHSTLITFPRDTEVLVNHSTYFNCSTSILSEQIHWYHYRVGESQTNYVYYKGQFNQIYADRYFIEINTKTAEYNLIIRSVKPEDAGRYVCQDDVGLGNSSSAELIVLESTPACRSSMKPDGFVGPNSCYLPVETLQLSCSVSYNGNIPPILKWKMDGNDAPILEKIATDYSEKHATVNLTMSPAVEMNGDFFTCGTTRSHDNQLSCATDQAKINYAVGQPTIPNIAKGGTTTCSANTSVTCTYRWFYDNDTQYPVSHNQVLTTDRLGGHSCEANCPINGFNCTFVAMRIIVSEGKPAKTSLISNILIPTIIVILLIIACFMIFRKLKGPPKQPLSMIVGEEKSPEPNDKQEEDHLGLLTEGDKTQAFIKVKEITTEASREWHKAIAGVAALNNMIYVVSDKSPEVELFDITTYELRHQYKLAELENPWDLTSCKLNKCLYVMDIKSPTTLKYVIRVDSNVVTCGPSLPTEMEYGNLSVTIDGDVIIAIYDKGKLIIYRPDGTDKTVVSLSADLIYPAHALKLRNGHLLTCHGINNDNNHRLCIIKKSGKIIKNCSETMETPSYLAVDKSRLVFVADQGSNRVIVLNSDLKLIGEVASKQNGLRSPKGICVVGKYIGKLFIVDNDPELGSRQRDGKVLIFTYDLSSQKIFCC